MKFISTTAVAAALFLQEAAATGWGNAKSFSNPSNTNNICTPEQKGGFKWDNLPTGGFNNFGGFNFAGFDCKDSFKPAKRSLNRRSNFQNKCIQGKVSKNGGNAPKISGGDKDFSITEMQVSVSFDTDLDFLFSMPDGSTCKHTAFCSAGGSVVKNEQCGGAKSVTFQMPPRGSDKGCDIGIHSIGFNCESASKPVTLATTTSSSSSTTSVPVTTTPATTPATTPSTTPVTTPSTTPVTTPATAPQTTPQTTPSSSTTTPGTITEPKSETTPATTPETTQPPVTTATSDLVTTEIVVTTLTTCPITTVTTDGNLTLTKTTSTISTTTLTSTATFCPKCGEAPPTNIQPGPPGSTPPSSPPPGSEQPSPPPPGSEQPPPATSAPPTDVLPPPPPGSEAPPTITGTPPPTDVITTEIVLTTLTTCPVTLTTTEGSSTITKETTTISTLVLTSTSTVCTRCTAAPPSTLTSATIPSAGPPSESPNTPPSPPAGPDAPPQNQTPDLPCPEILPRCLNTWLPSGCSSNSDTKCFCPSPDFASKAISCMTAWSASDEDLQKAASYFAGVCADFIPENPGICTNVPTSITLSPVPVPTNNNVDGGKGEEAVKEMPKTTVQVVETLTVTNKAGNKEPEISTTYITSMITVPQVQFITSTPTPTPAAGGAPQDAAAPAPTPSVGLVAAQTQGNSNNVPAAATSGVNVPTAATGTRGFNSPNASASSSFSAPSTFTGAAAEMKSVNNGLIVVAGGLAAVAFLV